MKRIILHWTAGAHRANSVDRAAYHRIYEGDGKMIPGIHPIEANSSKNAPLRAGKYAAHTRSCNTDSIGLSLACMAGAVEGKTNGTHPMTEAQFDAMCKDAAKLCVQYGIAVTPSTVLSHAEVQGTLKIAQAGKWDYTVLAFKPELRGSKACGDYARQRIQAYIDASKKTCAVS